MSRNQGNGHRNNGRGNQGHGGGGRKQRGGIGLLAILLGAACWILTIWQLVFRPGYEEPSTKAIVTQVVVGFGFMVGGCLWVWLWRTNADRKIDDLAAALHNLSALGFGLWAGGVRSVRSGQELVDMAALTGAHHKVKRHRTRREIDDVQAQLRYAQAAGRRDHMGTPVVVVVTGNGDPAHSSSAQTGPLPTAPLGLPPAGPQVSVEAMTHAMHRTVKRMIEVKNISWRADKVANPDGKSLPLDHSATTAIASRLDLRGLNLTVNGEQINCHRYPRETQQALDIVMRALRKAIGRRGDVQFWSEGLEKDWSDKLNAELLQLQNQP